MRAAGAVDVSRSRSLTLKEAQRPKKVARKRGGGSTALQCRLRDVPASLCSSLSKEEVASPGKVRALQNACVEDSVRSFRVTSHVTSTITGRDTPEMRDGLF